MSRGGTDTIKSIDKHIGGRLKAARVVLGITQEQVADHLGMTFQQIQKYERGDNRISAGALAIAALFLERPVAWFFEGTAAAGTAAIGSNAAPDLSSQLLASPHGLRLAEAFLAIAHTSDRAALASVAEAIARAPAAQLKAVG